MENIRYVVMERYLEEVESVEWNGCVYKLLDYIYGDNQQYMIIPLPLDLLNTNVAINHFTRQGNHEKDKTLL